MIWTPATDDGGTPVTGYKVTAYQGSTVAASANVDPSQTSTTLNGLTNGVGYTITVVATNAVGSSAPSSPIGTTTPENTIFDFSTPFQVDSGDTGAVTLGMQFKASLEGTITGVRFYKSTANAGPHTVASVEFERPVARLRHVNGRDPVRVAERSVLQPGPDLSWNHLHGRVLRPEWSLLRYPAGLRLGRQ